MTDNGNLPSGITLDEVLSAMTTVAGSADLELNRETVEREKFRLLVRDTAREEHEAEKRRAESERRGGPPEPASLTALLSEPDTDPQYLVNEVWPTGARVMLAAQYKAGKTTLVDNLCRSLADCAPFLGLFTVNEPRTVVIFDIEMDRRTRRRWLREQGIRNTDAIIVVTLRGKASSFDLLDPQTRREWAEVLRGHNADVVILDCLRPILDSLGLDENTDAGKFLVAFDELLDEAGVPDALVVHHMGHNGERQRGSSRLLDWPDATWKLVRESSDDDNPAAPRFFSAYGRDVDYAEEALRYDAATRHLALTGTGNRAATKALAALPDIHELLAANADEGLGMNEIEKAVMRDYEWSQKSVRLAVKAGVRQGSIVATPGPRRKMIHRYVEPTFTPDQP